MAEFFDEPLAAGLELLCTQVTTPDRSPFAGLLGQCWSNCDWSPVPAFTPDATPQMRTMYIPSLDANAPPVAVNSKQYHRILKRREARSKLRPYQRNKERRYVHESRHLHALSRQRGPKGMFLSRSDLCRIGRFSQVCASLSPALNK